MGHPLSCLLVLRRLLNLYFGCALFCAFHVHAGHLGFQVSYHPQTVAVINKGNEQVFQLTLYALDRFGQWRPQSSSDGQVQHHLNPEQAVLVQHSAHAQNALAMADPLLLVFYDASGTRFAHLAWRNQPALPPVLFPFQRFGPHVLIHQSEGVAVPYLRSWLIGLPSPGIAGLAEAPQAAIPPPPPFQMDWKLDGTTGQSVTVQTGKGQRGVWLVHEAAGGALYLQIIGDGITAGTEQMPVWLQFLKQYGYVLSLVLIVLGGLLTVLLKISQTSKTWTRLLSALRGRVHS